MTPIVALTNSLEKPTVRIDTRFPSLSFSLTSSSAFRRDGSVASAVGGLALFAELGSGTRGGNVTRVITFRQLRKTA